MGQAREAEGKLELAVKAYAYSKKRLKETLFHLTEVEKSRKNAKSALAKQAKETRASLKKAKTQLALAIEKTKQQQK